MGLSAVALAKVDRESYVVPRYTDGVMLDATPSRDDEQPPPGYRLQAEDTSYAIERMLIEAWRAMTPAEKARHLTACCRAVDRLALAGLRLRHPHADDTMLRRHAATMRLGPELARAVYGPDPLADLG